MPAPYSANIARHLAARALAHPAQAALKVPRGRQGERIDYLVLTYADLSAEVMAWRDRLTRAGIRPGDRALVMVRQGLPLIAVVFALFELGASPVIIDPGMGRKNFLRCVAQSRPRALVGIPLARLLSRVFWRDFRTVEVRVAVPGSTVARAARIGTTRPANDPGALPRRAEDEAAVLFTSGSTGSPKGVLYTHGQLDAQISLIRETYGIEPGEIDLPLLPLFALFAPALGMTAIIPEMDPSRPAQANPMRLVEAIRQEGVTTSFGSPTLWGNIAWQCRVAGLTLPSLRRVLCAGAPVPPWLWEAMCEVMPQGVLHSPYGATECLPVSTVSGPEMRAGLSEAALTGAGACVGRPLTANRVKIIRPPDGPLANLTDACELPTDEIGEIIVTGPTVTHAYDGLPEATAAAKITGPDGEVWHRMGDLGRIDAEGRLWFAGRRAEAVRTERGWLHPARVEPVLGAHPRVRRCALIGIGPAHAQRPAVVVETLDPPVTGNDSAECRRLARELRQLALACPVTAAIKVFYFHPGLPVDVRHNAKIHRLTLARWAATEGVGYESDPKR